MTQTTRSSFQVHPFHLVSPSPWPIYTSISLLVLTTSGVLTMHGFFAAQDFVFLGLLSVILSMVFWFRDIIGEGKIKINLWYFIIKILGINNNDNANVLNREDVNKMENIYEFEYYLAGLLERGACVYLPYKENIILNTILNPKIIFTCHIKDLNLYKLVKKNNKMGKVIFNLLTINYVI